MFRRALMVLEMTAKSQVNSFYSSQGILVPRVAGSRLIKHSLITFDLSLWNYFKPILKTTNIEKVAFGSPSEIVIRFSNQFYWQIYHSNSRSYKGLYVVIWYVHISSNRLNLGLFTPSNQCQTAILGCICHSEACFGELLRYLK